ncbi:MAG: tripartite tricarboxylate transporter permease [Lawsonibacter sp.]|jgi:putative tricarboxylic transport membrane protein
MNLSTLQDIFTLSNILMMNVGMVAGILIGAMPGLNVIFAIAILLPLTFGMDSLAGMYLMLASYCGATFGGSITAILINTPGTANAAATVFDGYPLAQKGRAGDALKTALVGSTIGGILSCIALLFFAPKIAKIALHVASPEYFALCVFGLASVVGLSNGNVIKGLAMGIIGLALSTVGIDATDGVQRFMFGNSQLLAGFRPATVMLGIFAVSEVLIKCRNISKEDLNQQAIPFQKATIRIVDILKYWKTILKSSIFGIVIGAIPGTGGAIASMLSYNEARRGSKNPQEFGKGCIEGVLAPETGNNAVTGATLIPLLTLGIPGDAAVAVLLGALTMQGVTPGAALFAEGSTWVYAIMGGLLLINVFMFLQGQLFINLFVNITKVPILILLPCIVVVTTMGAFSIANTTFDVFVMVAFGLFGYVMRSFNFPIAPLAIGLVLGNLAETNLRRSLLLSKGSVSIFFTRPISAAILLLAFLLLFSPAIKKLIGKYKTRKSAISRD